MLSNQPSPIHAGERRESNVIDLARVLLEPRDRHRPCLLGRFHVGAVVAGLRAEEAVRRAVEDMWLVYLAKRFHLRFGWSDGGADACILRQPAVETDDRRLDVGDALRHFVWTGRRAARGR